MNCQKCNSPLNEGDKFCQVCGSIVENNAPAVQPQPVETPVAPEQPVTPTVNGFQFDAQGNVIAAPQSVQPGQQTPQTQPLTNIQFDENGIVVSA